MTIEDYQYLIKEYGSDKGWAYEDKDKKTEYSIFSDKIIIRTNFLDLRTYEIFEDDEELNISKSNLNEESQLVGGDMEDEDWDIVYLHWDKLILDLKSVKQLEKLDIPSILGTLLKDILGNSADQYISKLPKSIEPSPDAIWSILSKILKDAGILVAFEWENWIEKGIPAVNQLAILKTAKVVIENPTESEDEEINNTLYYTTAILDYFNSRLEKSFHIIIAVGAQFEELQTFACFSANDEQLTAIEEKLDQLCLKYEY